MTAETEWLKPLVQRLKIFVLNLILPTLCLVIQEKRLVATVGIEPRPHAQESESILTKLTHHLLMV